MSRTYIKLNIQETYNTQTPGGIYLDSIGGVKEYSKDRTTLLLNGNSHCWAIINKPLAEVEQLLVDANIKRPRELNWREFSGKPQEPPKEPKKGLAKRFHLKR